MARNDPAASADPTWTRRRFAALLAALPLSGLAGWGCTRAGTVGGPSAAGPAEDPEMTQPPPHPPSRRAPVGFVGHGAPLLAVDPVKGADLVRWSAGMPRPTAVLSVSAHWQTGKPTLGTTTPRELVYDFSGFPRALYEVRYPAPGAPDLARRLESLLQAHGGVARQEPRGLDHGVWVPLVHLFPQADLPVLQLSLPAMPPAELFRLGQLLAPLRDEGVFVLASGNMTHNLRLFDGRTTGRTPAWAAEFDQWAAEVLLQGDVDALIDHRNRAPAFTMSHPTDEHFLPLLVAAGAGQGGAVTFPVEGFEYDHLSRRCVQFG